MENRRLEFRKVSEIPEVGSMRKQKVKTTSSIAVAECEVFI